LAPPDPAQPKVPWTLSPGPTTAIVPVDPDTNYSDRPEQPHPGPDSTSSTTDAYS